MKLKLTRERMILGGLLAAAAVGLLTDQLLFASETTPDDVSAAALPNAAAAKGPRPATPISTEQRLADRLVQLAGAGPTSMDDLRDVFADASSSRIAPGERRSVGGGWSKRTLNGVLFGVDGKGVAIIDGRMVPVGTRLDGMRLLRVTQTLAVFGDGRSEITLRITQKTSAAN